MESEEIELDYEGDTFRYTVERIVECEHCGYQWGTESEMNRPTCPGCSRKTDRQYRRRYHFYIKEAWWMAEPEPSVHQHTEALRVAAKRLEALAANGWELTQSDGEHVYFEEQASGEQESSFNVDDTLE